MSLPSTDISVAALLEASFAGVEHPDRKALLDRFVDGAFAFASETLGLSDLREAWATFRVWLDCGVDTRADDWRLFVVWYVFHWHSRPKEGGTRPEQPSIAERYLRERPDAESPEMHLLVRSAIGTPMDFYQIHHLPELGRFYAKSLLLGYKQSFGFAELPAGIEVEGVYLAKIVHLYADEGVIAGTSVRLPASAKVAVAYLRRNLICNRATDFTRDFWLFDSDVFNLYHELREGSS